ncbi:hypothetical protein RZS08_18320 [Arthrospira platensis SPKY1]|nr:hypothetical protein [Arthrospira platensis SPKY1]
MDSMTTTNGSDSLQNQLIELYREVITFYKHREVLLRHLGTTDAEQVVSMVQSMEEQLKDVYVTRDSDSGQAPQSFQAAGEAAMDADALERELGTSDAEAIIAMVKNMEDQLRDFYAMKDEGEGALVDSGIQF